MFIAPHNLTNKFRPLDIIINQSAKKFISNKYNTWYADRVSKQLSNGVAPGNVKVSLKLSDLNLTSSCSVDCWDIQSSQTPKWFHHQWFRCCRVQQGYHMCKRCLRTSRKPFRWTETTTEFLVVSSLFSWKHNLIGSFESIDFPLVAPLFDYRYGSKGSSDVKNKKRHLN